MGTAVFGLNDDLLSTPSTGRNADDVAEVVGRVELKQIEAFVRVAWARSYTRAAVALNITQPAVSARVSSLERELGRTLFRRSGNNIDLTDAGRELLPHAEEMLRLATEAVESVLKVNARRSPVQILRVGANNLTASGALSHWIHIFANMYGRRHDVRLDLVVDRTPSLMPQLLDGSIEIAFVSPSLAHDSTQALWRHQSPLVLVARADHDLAGSVLRVEDLADVTLVGLRNGVAAAEIQRIRRKLGRDLRVVATSSSANLVRELVAMGSGMTFIPSDLVADQLECGELIEIKLADHVTTPWEVALVRWRTRPLSRPAKAFVEILRTVDAQASGVELS